MINMATSYFYHVRFFKAYMIPISTAVWDPKWFHNSKGQDHIYIDKRGVVNGLRIRPLMPGDTCADLCRGPELCSINDPSTCEFLKAYRAQLDTINAAEFVHKLEAQIRRLLFTVPDGRDPLVVFLFHEKTDNPCSERSVVQQWFKDNGYNVGELIYPVEHNY